MIKKDRSECWVINKKKNRGNKIGRSENESSRRIRGVTRRDRVRNERFRGSLSERE